MNLQNENMILFIRAELEQLASTEGQMAAQKFHKEKIQSYGIKIPVLRKRVKEWFQKIKHLEKEQIFQMCDTLFQSGILEEAFIASEWAFLLKRKFAESDFIQFRHWIQHHVNNWSICDNFCNNAVGAFLLAYPEYVGHLDQWANSHNRWLQRAAAVSLIVPARQGLFLEEILQNAKYGIGSHDDLVQKGHGWLLKVASKKHLAAVHGYIMNNKHNMPRTMLRYAIEHFPENLKAEAML